MKSLVFLLALLAGFAGAAEIDPRRAAGEIEALLAADWQRLRIQPNAPASDEVFVRRIYLDGVGRIPTQRETAAFLASKEKDKRARLIDALLASEGSTAHLFHFWADLLRVLSKGTYSGLAGLNMGTAYANYVEESVRANKPYDQFVRELVTARGVAWENGAVGYYQRDRGMPLENMALTSRIFLGTRIECAQCHDHPFDKWKQKDFYELAAFTYGVQTAFGTYSPRINAMFALNSQRRGSAAAPADEVFLRQAFNEMIIPVKHNSVVFRPEKLRLPDDYQYPDDKPKTVVQPAVLLGQPAKVEKGVEAIDQFGAWLTSPENPRFTKVIVNRLWRKTFGRGLVEPVDAWTDETVAATPALLAYLEKLMVGGSYDVRSFLRLLFNTQTYQREVTRAEISDGAEYHFPGPILRRMSAEQLWDSLVTLIDPAPDRPNLAARDATATLLANLRKLGDALETLTPEELLASADATSAIFREHSETIKGLQKQIAEARARDDKAAVKTLSVQQSQLRQSEMQTANDLIFAPAVRKLAAKLGAPAASGETYEQIRVPGYDPAPLTAAREAEHRALLAQAKDYGLPEAQWESYAQHRVALQKTWTRAIALGSPAPPGHALREFGQSDRETVDNANLDASVPLALVLMNSAILSEVTNPFSQLMLVLRTATDADAQADAACLTLFSRRASAAEKAAWRKAQAGGVSRPDDLIHALLNTQQFLYIQ